ncbi:MAG TPA: hypothetical protein VEO54_31875 [Thermoanaerobaculia bacterium]|nr:hypothetical protein [Thermoanaerobaculia bacterium]
MKRGALAVIAVWLASTLLWLTPGISRPDGAGYFAYLPSTYFDRDLLFFDEWARIGLVRPDGQILFKDVTETAHLSNHWTAGASLAWYPAFVIGDLLARVTGAPRDGFSTPYVAAVVTMTALAGLLTLLLGTAMANGKAAIAVWLGSPLAYYSLRAPTMSHAISALACAVVVWLSARKQSAFAIGLAIGFACAVRPQNAPIALVPFFFGWRLAVGGWRGILGGALLAALPQFIVSQTLWGAPLAFVNIGGSAHPWQMFATFRPFETLFSWYHGLVPWTPLLVLALIGLALVKDRRLAYAGLTLFAAQWLLLSVLERWFWGGASFGQRRFDSCTLFFIIGVAAFLERVPRWLGALSAIAATSWTMLLFVASSRLNLNRYATPSELLEAFGAALDDPRWRAPLGFMPPEMRGDVLLALVVTAPAVVALGFAVRKAPVAVAAAYLALMSAFFAWCGLHPKHDALSRTLLARPQIAGAKRDTITLLLYEAEYMERTGRPREAAKARAEAAGMGP